jgi:hypothetical protein
MKLWILLTYLLTELSPSWGAASCAVTQELLSILWNPEVQYRVHKSPPLVPIVSHMNPTHTIPSYLRSILILPIHLHLGFPSALFPSQRVYRTPWTESQSVPRPLLTQDSTNIEKAWTYIDISKEVRIHDSNAPAGKDISCVGPSGHCDRLNDALCAVQKPAQLSPSPKNNHSDISTTI